MSFDKQRGRGSFWEDLYLVLYNSITLEDIR